MVIGQVEAGVSAVTDSPRARELARRMDADPECAVSVYRELSALLTESKRASV